MPPLHAFILFVLCFLLCSNTALLDFTRELCRADRCHTIPEMIFAILLISLCLFLFITLVIFILRKHDKAKYGFLFIAYIILFVLYIHGNFLTSSLNVLNGMAPLSKGHPSDFIISAILVIIIIVCTLLIPRINVKKATRISAYLAIAIIIMLSVSIINTMLTQKMIFRPNHNTAIATNKNINTYSENKNFIIFMADAVDSKTFDNVRKNSKYKDIFKDFTYYPDTLGAYDNTAISIPFIFSGDWYENKESYESYSKNAYKKSDFLKYLKENNYDINLYETDFTMDYEQSKDILNLSYTDNDVNISSLVKEEIKYFNFKFLPYFLKKYSNIENFDLSHNSIGIKKSAYAKKYGFYDWSNQINYDNIVKSDIDKSNNNQFKLIHIEGSHAPFNMDEDLETIYNGTYEQKIEATLKVFDAYITKLKENNMYDNSVIIFMADHGFNTLTPVGNQNPILFIKGIDEHHDYKVSDKAISYADLTSAYEDLLNNKKSTQLFENVNKNRKRRYFVATYYEFAEYYQTGKAWDLTTMKKSNKSYHLKEK